MTQLSAVYSSFMVHNNELATWYYEWSSISSRSNILSLYLHSGLPAPTQGSKC